MDEAEEGGADDNAAPERGPGRRSWLPSSMGLSLLVEEGTPSLRATVRWGDYRREGARPRCRARAPTPARRCSSRDRARERRRRPGDDPDADEGPPALAALSRARRRSRCRSPPAGRSCCRTPAGSSSPGTCGRPASEPRAASARCSRCRCSWSTAASPIEDPGREDEAKAFQVELEVAGREAVRRPCRSQGLCASRHRCADRRPALPRRRRVGGRPQCLGRRRWSRTAPCRRVRTAWLPEAYVPRIEVGQVDGVERRHGGAGRACRWRRRPCGAGPAARAVPGLDRGARRRTWRSVAAAPRGRRGASERCPQGAPSACRTASRCWTIRRCSRPFAS